MTAALEGRQTPAALREFQLQVGMAKCPTYGTARMMQSALLMQHRADVFVAAVRDGHEARIVKRLGKLRHSYALCMDAVYGPHHSVEQDIEQVLRRSRIDTARVTYWRNMARWVRNQADFGGAYPVDEPHPSEFL